jgi:hypothetical protein
LDDLDVTDPPDVVLADALDGIADLSFRGLLSARCRLLSIRGRRQQRQGD